MEQLVQASISECYEHVAVQNFKRSVVQNMHGSMVGSLSLILEIKIVFV
jgi:hypothetical protein